MTDLDLESRLRDALDSGAAATRVSPVPTFSWQDSDVQDTSAQDRPTGRFRTRRTAFLGAGLVAAAAAASVLVAALPSGGGSTPGTASPKGQGHTVQQAPNLLLVAAQTSLKTGDPVLRAGEYRYVRTEGPAPTVATPPLAGHPGSGSTQAPPAGAYTLDELWIPKDRSDVWMRRQSVVGEPAAGRPLVWTGRCDDLYANTQDGPKGGACTRQGTFEDPTPAFVAALPRDADALYTQLHAFAAGRLNPDKIHDADFAMFSAINDLLVGGTITSDLTATLYTVLSRIPGITVVPGATNAAGVAGTGFRLATTLGTNDTDTMTIIVDTGTGAYLGYHEVSDGQDYLDAVSTGVATHIGVAGR